MKAIKDCELVVIIYQTNFNTGTGKWTARTEDEIGLEKLELNSIGDFQSEKLAKANFEHFAKLNGITNYKFI